MVVEKSVKVLIIQVLVFLIAYYILLWIFLLGNVYASNTIILKARLGTILFQSTSGNKGSSLNQNLVEHIYCYYPKGNVYFSGNKSELYFKKAGKIDDCSSWFGIVVRYEYEWMSEDNMLKSSAFN